MRTQTSSVAPTVPSASMTLAADPFEQALLNSMPISDADFSSLASDRAKAVRDYLIQAGKVEPDRVDLAETQNGGFGTDGARASVEFR